MSKLGNFSFVIEKKLAGSARPGLYRELNEDLEFMKSQGIGAVVSLTEAPLAAREVIDAGLVYLHIPVQDFTPPTPQQFQQFQDFMNRQPSAVLVHCHAGMGRTGTMLASYLISQGLSVEEAITQVRQARPGSIETGTQINALRAWADHLGGIKK